MRFITFEEWKKLYPELADDWEICELCQGAGVFPLDELYPNDPRICHKCHGEGQINLSRELYEKHKKQARDRYDAWVKGEPIHPGPGVQRLDIIKDIDWLP